MTPKEMEDKIKADNWYLVKIEGAHHHYKHPTKLGKVTIPFHTKPKVNITVVGSIAICSSEPL